MANFTENPKLSNRYANALSLAFKWHQNQIRKQDEIPYISHLLAVSSLVLEAGGSEDEAIAALLHDAIEDANQTYEEIRFHFGDYVADVVKALTADSHHEYLNNITESHIDIYDSVLLVSAADKLHNLRCYFTNGRELWTEKHSEFYNALIQVYASRVVPRQ